MRWIHKGLVAIGLMLALPAVAHEFWLEPLHYQLAVGERLRAHIKIGQHFKGNSHPYFSRQFSRFDLAVAENIEAVQARLGSIPAVSQDATTNGLTLLLYQSTDQQLTYQDAETFQQFIAKEGLDWVGVEHQAQGYPPSHFSETYRRFAKSYVAVGDGQGADRRFGLAFEWLLLDNPYQLPASQSLNAQLWWQDKPLAGALVRVLIRQGETLQEQRFTTNDQGVVAVPYYSAAEYLINSVQMLKATDINPPVVSSEFPLLWRSFWASATFFRP